MHAPVYLPFFFSRRPIRPPSLPSFLPPFHLSPLRHGMDAVKHLLSAGGNEEARKKAEKERTNTDADVIQFSGCRDDQTSADAKIGGREGEREGRREGGGEGGRYAMREERIGPI